MNIRKLTSAAVADQISAADVEAIASAGYRAIVCNRPIMKLQVSRLTRY